MVIPGHNLGNSQVSVNRTIGPTLVIKVVIKFLINQEILIQGESGLSNTSLRMIQIHRDFWSEAGL